MIAGLESRCGYVILLMATYWVTEALPLPITALLPGATYLFRITVEAAESR
jgi:di/tricarboxylate transporter